MPKTPYSTASRCAWFNKFIDEYLHTSCMILTFGTAFRAGIPAHEPRRSGKHSFPKSPIQKACRMPDAMWSNMDLGSKYVREALHGTMRKLLALDR